MPDEERIEQLELEIKVLRANNKGLKDKIDEQSKEIEELKEKNKTLKNLQNDTNGLYIEMIERKNYFERELQKLEAKIKAKIEELKKDIQYSANPLSIDNSKFGIKILQSLLEKE